MSDANAQRWQEMAGGAPASAPPAPAPPALASPQPQAFQPPVEGKKAKKEKKDKEKGKRERRQKPPKAPSASRSRAHGDDVPLLDLGRETRSREQLMQAGAEDLMQALTGSYQLLHAEVPDSSSPDDAMRKIEAQLGRFATDNDADVPDHPIYQGDALVYHQLRRHYGLVQPGNTQGRLGGSLRRSDSIHKGISAAQERGNRPRY